MTKHQAVLITGAAKRLGRTMALEYAQAGYDVALHYHRSAQEAEETAQEILRMGRQCVMISQNLENLHAMPALAAEATKAFPHLSVLVNNASVFDRISFAETTPETLLRDYTLNFAQAFFLTQAFAVAVKTGSVVNMLDTSVHIQRTTHFGYLLAKKTLREFTKMGAKELAPAIRVNAICPGFILPTEGGEHRDPVAYAAKLPLKRQPTPADVAYNVRVLSENQNLTGHIITIDGGEYLC